MSEAACAGSFDGDTIVSVDYDPVTQGCAKYTCDGNINATDDTTVWQIRKTTNSGLFYNAIKTSGLFVITILLQNI